MIEFMNGDMFRLDADAYVNPVNCVGVMGRGVALAFKTRYPATFDAYEIACREGQVRLGQVWVHRENGKALIHFPTKGHWREKSELNNVVSGLKSLTQTLKNMPDIKTIALPALGCGLGGLSWQDVRPEIEAALSHLDEKTIYVFEPIEEPPIKFGWRQPQQRKLPL